MNDFYTSLAQFELLAFFSGYPLIYSLVRTIAPVRPAKPDFRTRLVVLSPMAYALLATLYLGLQLKELYPDYSFGHVTSVIRQNYLRLWGMLAVLFWLPPFSKRPVLSLGHSLVVLSLLVYDLIIGLSGKLTAMDTLRNDMNVYTFSLMLNVIAYLLIAVIAFLYYRFRPNRYDKPHPTR